MFILELYDINGNILNIGDIVKVTNTNSWSRCTFYTEVTYLENQCAISPFHTFSFHYFEKVNKIPDNAIKMNEPDFNAWYVENENKNQKEDYEKYFRSWHDCEFFLDKRCYRIKLENKTLFD